MVYRHPLSSIQHLLEDPGNNPLNLLSTTNTHPKLFSTQTNVSNVNSGTSWRTGGVKESTTERLGGWLSKIITRWWFQIFYMFNPTWGNDPILTKIFQMDWNHQPENHKRALRSYLASFGQHRGMQFFHIFSILFHPSRQEPIRRQYICKRWVC